MLYHYEEHLNDFAALGAHGHLAIANDRYDP